MAKPITKIIARERRFKLSGGAGSDAVHVDPVYAYAVAEFHTEDRTSGTGLAFTLGAGTELVCQTIDQLAAPLVGREIEELMSEFGAVSKALADHHQLRWLGPHKGVVHLALAAITNACFDLWAKSRGVPLWKLLLDLSPRQLVQVMDLSYLQDVLPRETAVELLQRHFQSRSSRSDVLHEDYPGYDTSAGWFGYSDDKIRANAAQAVKNGFTAVKLKVGSPDLERDRRREVIVREAVGDNVLVMLDCNQQWTLPQAIRACLVLSHIKPYWMEEPTHPDDVLAHRTLAHAIAPLKIALGEHVPNRVIFKNYLQSQAAGFIQVDCLRVAGVSEFLAVSLMAKLFNIPVVPHVGDTGQIHQHLVLYNHIAMGHPRLFLEYIPHLREYFVHPAQVQNGVYLTPEEPGAACDLKSD